MRKLNKQNVSNLSETLHNNELHFRINSKDEIINLNKLSVKYNVKISSIEIYINESIETYIPMIARILSSDNISVSLQYYFYLKLNLGLF